MDIRTDKSETLDILSAPLVLISIIILLVSVYMYEHQSLEYTIVTLSLILVVINIKYALAWRNDYEEYQYGALKHVYAIYLNTSIFFAALSFPLFYEFGGTSFFISASSAILLFFSMRYIMFRDIPERNREVIGYGETPPVIYEDTGSYVDHVEEIAEENI